MIGERYRALSEEMAADGVEDAMIIVYSRSTALGAGPILHPPRWGRRHRAAALSNFLRVAWRGGEPSPLPNGPLQPGEKSSATTGSEQRCLR
jgi:hypothetical protein